jgi:glycosyltransferase involved in cell wall biosynthesis
MRTVHIVRKYDLAEWGGTETAVQRLLRGLSGEDIDSVLYCPSLNGVTSSRVPIETSFAVKYYRACVPVWGLTPDAKRQFVSLGGNLFSFDLLPALCWERGVDLVHTHALGRLGAMGAFVAQRWNVPFVVTIHGGFLDLPAPMKREFSTPQREGFDWGRIFGFLLRSRQMLEVADALLTCNSREAELLRAQFPGKRVEVQPHGLPVAQYCQDCREATLRAWPQLRTGEFLVCLGRIDPVKNQVWLVEQAPELFRRHQYARLVLAGPITDEACGAALKRQIAALGLEDRILLTGALPPGDGRLIGLLQSARALILPSISETFGLVLLEAWAAGTTVIASATSGARALVKDGENGCLFDLDHPESFHTAVDTILNHPRRRASMAAAGSRKVARDFDLPVIARGVRQLYHQLIEAKSCVT